MEMPNHHNLTAYNPAMKRYKFLSLLLGLCIFQSVGADSVLEFLVSQPGGKSVKRLPVAIKNGRILVRGAGGDETLDFIYSTSPEQLSIIDHRKHSVMTLDENQVNRIVKQTETLQPLLQGLGEQIGKLNPRQRARWEEMLGGKIDLGKIAEAAKPEQMADIVKTGQGRKIAGIACEQINVFQGKKKTAEICLADPGKMNISGADYETLRSLFSFSERLAAKTQGLARQFGVNLPKVDLTKLAGVPVELLDFSGTSQAGLKLSRVISSSVSDELIQIPTGYQNEPFNLWK